MAGQGSECPRGIPRFERHPSDEPFKGSVPGERVERIAPHASRASVYGHVSGFGESADAECVARVLAVAAAINDNHRSPELFDGGPTQHHGRRTWIARVSAKIGIGVERNDVNVLGLICRARKPVVSTWGVLRGEPSHPEARSPMTHRPTRRWILSGSSHQQIVNRAAFVPTQRANARSVDRFSTDPRQRRSGYRVGREGRDGDHPPEAATSASTSARVTRSTLLRHDDERLTFWRTQR
jgi:hypothetical protein